MIRGFCIVNKKALIFLLIMKYYFTEKCYALHFNAANSVWVLFPPKLRHFDVNTSFFLLLGNRFPIRHRFLLYRSRISFTIKRRFSLLGNYFLLVSTSFYHETHVFIGLPQNLTLCLREALFLLNVRDRKENEIL